jgi:hypothetical protein
VEQDFVPAPGNNVQVTPTSAIVHLNRPSWIVAAGQYSGMDFKDVRLAYDPTTDTLAVGINFNGIGGDIDGNGVVGTVGPQAAAAGTVEPLRFGNLQTVALGFDVTGDRFADFVAGIPLVKPTNPATGQRLDGVAAFTVAKYQDNPNGLPSGFGPTVIGSTSLPAFLGRTQLETSAEKPGIEFELRNFSQLAQLFNPSFDPTRTLVTLSGYSGDLNAAMIGKSIFTYSFQSPLAQTVIPEPAALWGWSVVAAGAAAWRWRRRRQPAPR